MDGSFNNNYLAMRTIYKRESDTSNFYKKKWYDANVLNMINHKSSMFFKLNKENVKYNKSNILDIIAYLISNSESDLKLDFITKILDFEIFDNIKIIYALDDWVTDVMDKISDIIGNYKKTIKDLEDDYVISADVYNGNTWRLLIKK